MGNGLGERLRQVREHREISQGRLARAIGVTVGTIQNYEHGRALITTDRVEQLAHALQCEPIDLLAKPGSAPPRYRYNQRRYRALLAKIRGLSADDED
jgi:transcriptional regulator with XRE-family HTH domain